MEKETVTTFNLEAAFKALDDLTVPEASGGVRANRINLQERFQAKSSTEVLIEDYFDVNQMDELEAAKEAREAEIAKAKLARIEKIVDLEAETEEDLLPSYVGKLIIQCPQCMTLFYKNAEDVEKSEETPEIVNINEICQHCGNSSGYNLIGKVDTVGEAEAEQYDVEDFEEDELNITFPEEGTEEVDPEGTGEGANEESDTEEASETADKAVEEDTEDESIDTEDETSAESEVEDETEEEVVEEAINELEVPEESEEIIEGEDTEETDPELKPTVLNEETDAGNKETEVKEAEAEINNKVTDAEDDENAVSEDIENIASEEAEAEANEEALPETTEALTEATEAEENILDKVMESEEFKTPVSETEVEAILNGPRFTETPEPADLEGLEDFDEAFDAQVTEYLKETYANVAAYNSTACSLSKESLIVEGKISFTSGREKDTKFIFTVAENLGNTVMFKGANKTLTEETDAYTLNCKIENTNLIAENFGYKYTIDNTLVEGLI